MDVQEHHVKTTDSGGKPDAIKPPASQNDQKLGTPRVSSCRVCHCAEPDLRGESALRFLGIAPLSPDPDDKDPSNDAVTGDVESGPLRRHDDVVSLGCSCKNELALAHYACALKWFVSRGSTVCEICGNVAADVRPEDFNKVLASVKDYEALRERTSTGELSYLHYRADAAVDPAALAAIRRRRLSEITSWFSPHNNTHVVFSQRPS